MKEWIGVDLDGTLACYEIWRGADYIGEPIKPMLDRVKKWLSHGKTVKIFTARAAVVEQIPFVKKWLLQNDLPALEVTNVKDMWMVELWDDRCIQVEKNTGKINLRSSRDNNIINMNLLFYGPPGTGKSQLARNIASRIDQEIVSKSNSDLMDKYVGGTEKNIRDAFLEAELKDALLIFDEVDSIIFDRESAQRSWEISHTNEFLMQMERFRGVLICTINRLTGIDKASIRRFNHKIRFDFLEPEGGLIFENYN